jgi:hypothetical protein
VFDNVERKKKTLMGELLVFDITKEERDLGVKERMRNAEVVSELERSTLTDKVSWR